MTTTWMTFSATFSYLEGEHLNDVVWALECFRDNFLKCDALPRVIVTNRDLTLMNVVKTVFPKSTNLLCRFHIDKNMKAKCKILVDKKKCIRLWHRSLGSLVDCPSEQNFDECFMKFEIACSPWLHDLFKNINTSPFQIVTAT